MKIRPYLTLCLICVLSACASNESHKEGLGKPLLYTLANPKESCTKEKATVPASQSFDVNNLDAALDALLASAPNDETLLVYIHGRAAGEEKEPDKSLKFVIPCLQSENKVRVLMFFWPGSAEGGALGFPVDQARNAAPELEQTLAKLALNKQKNNNNLQHRKIVLLPHSLGNIVLEKVMESYAAGSLPKKLFNTIILSASASPAKEHADWLRRVDFSDNIYVVVNSDDPVLDKAGMREIEARLGKKLKTAFAGKVALAKNAIYLDISDTEADTHRYFLHPNQEGNQYLRMFFENVLIGSPLDFKGFKGIESIEKRDGTHVYHLKR